MVKPFQMLQGDAEYFGLLPILIKNMVSVWDMPLTAIQPFWQGFALKPIIRIFVYQFKFETFLY